MSWFQDSPFGNFPSGITYDFGPAVPNKKYPCKGCGEEFYESELKTFNLRVGDKLHQQNVCDNCSDLLMNEVKKAGAVAYDQDDETVQCISCGVVEPVPTFPKVPHQCESCSLKDQGPPRYRVKPKSRNKYHK